MKSLLRKELKGNQNTVTACGFAHAKLYSLDPEGKKRRKRRKITESTELTIVNKKE